MSIINYKLPDFFLEKSPFPHIMQDNFLTNDFALELRNEILNIPSNSWDRYNNPFK